MGKIGLLYSVNARYVYLICRDYYGGNFREVFAAERFNMNPRTSNPRWRNEEFLRIIKGEPPREDNFRKDIADTMLNVALNQRKEGNITDKQFDEVENIILLSKVRREFFLPVIYIIEHERVESTHKSVNGKGKPTNEYHIEEMTIDDFEVICVVNVSIDASYDHDSKSID